MSAITTALPRLRGLLTMGLATLKRPKLTVTFLLAFIGCTTAFPSLAALTITSATWDGKKLTIEGTDGKSGSVEVYYGYDTPPNSNLLGIASVKGNGRWTLRINSNRNNPLDPVPCAVSATLAGDPDVLNFPVAGADPDTCAPQPPVVDECNIAVAPQALDFGDVQVGTTSASQTTTVSNSGGADCNVTITQTGSTDFLAAPLSFVVAPAGSQDVTVDYTPDVVGADDGNLAVGSNDPDSPNVDVSLSGNGVDQGGNAPVANDDNFVVDTTVIDRNGQADITAPGVLINDTDPDGDPISAVAASGTTSAGGNYNLLADGSFSYIPPAPNFTGADSFSYNATDGANTSLAATVNLPVQTNLQVNTTNQNQFNIMMNYELGMHCTGFEFAYCCVLPPYNSIIAQVVKTDKDPVSGSNDSDFPKLLEGDPANGLDQLGRETVLRDPQLDGNGNFQKYVLRYWHDAQPRNDGRGRPQSSTMISAVEANSMFMWNTVYDAADTDAGNNLVTGTYQGSTGVVLGDGDYTDANDNYGSGWMNHFYIYQNLEGGNPTVDVSAEKDKIRLGLENLNASTPLSLVVPDDCGPAFHPMGPDTQSGVPGGPVTDNTCGPSNGNLLTFSTDHGTVVFTQMKVLENLPVMLTSPRIWEALGLPLTPFEDTIDFFADPGLVDEDSIRPFVQMKAALHNFDPTDTTFADGDALGVGNPVLDNGLPVIGFGTAPIDIPNCERCHSELQLSSQNSAQQIGGRNADVAALVQQEMDFWNGFYTIDTGAGDSDWYSRLKGAAISILAIHDNEHGTSFTANYPGDPADTGNPGFGSGFPQNTRLGNESVICQKCHADNVIAVVKSANCGPDNETGTTPCATGTLIPPITEAIHDNHRNVSDGGIITFADSLGRDGGCQGCHPAHRSDGDMAGYPITIEGDNFYASVDNRDANGGCFVGRDVHSNRGKDSDGAETPEHLNPVGTWLSQNVFSDQHVGGGDKGIWCTNCHTQIGQEIWRQENMVDLIHGVPGKEADLVTDAPNIRELPFPGDGPGTLAEALGIPSAELISMLDPNANNPKDHTWEIWSPTRTDANVATIEINAGGICNVAPWTTSSGGICVALDVDGDPSVRILEGFCTTPDCVALAQATLDAEGNGSDAVAVPFSAADDGRDHWLSPGEPHCADCHSAPYTEQSGNINAFPPFNYPRKASLMRYSRGHQDISCQGCHESIHGLYPVTPTIDTTSYAQAANLNHDGTHGPVKCGGCHEVDGEGIPTWIRNNAGGTLAAITDFDSAIGWAHTYTDENSVLTSTCRNCHDVQGNNWDEVNDGNDKYLEHAMDGNKDLPRGMMDKAETELYGAVFTSADGSDGLCVACHGNETSNINCGNTEWKLHLTEGRVAQSTWETVSVAQTGSTCGW